MKKFVLLLVFGLILGLRCNVIQCNEVKTLEGAASENLADKAVPVAVAEKERDNLDVLKNAEAEASSSTEPHVRQARQFFGGFYPRFYRRGFFGRRRFRRRRFFG